MSKMLEQIKGYLKAFAVINDGNYEGPDYLIDEIEHNGNELISIEDYLMKITNSNKEPLSLSFERIENWQEPLEILFEHYFTRNVKLLTDLYKTEFIEMISSYINNESVEVLGSGISNGYSCITEYFREVSGSDLLFVFNEKILILHFGIND